MYNVYAGLWIRIRIPFPYFMDLDPGVNKFREKLKKCKEIGDSRHVYNFYS